MKKFVQFLCFEIVSKVTRSTPGAMGRLVTAITLWMKMEYPSREDSQNKYWARKTNSSDKTACSQYVPKQKEKKF